MEKPMIFDEVFKEAYDYWIDDTNIHRYEGAKGLAEQVWQHRQAKVKELQKLVDAFKDHAVMLRKAAKSYAYTEREQNILLSQTEDIEKILGLEQALKGEGQ